MFSTEEVTFAAMRRGRDGEFFFERSGRMWRQPYT